MDEIRQLLLKSGLTEQVTDQLCESFEAFVTSTKEKFEKDYQYKLEHDKQLCVEATEAHKKELSRRLQIYLESRNKQISEQISGHLTKRGTESSSRLQQVARLLEGVKNDGPSNSELVSEMTKLRKAAKILREEADKQKLANNRLKEVAKKTLDRNVMLEQRNKQLNESLQTRRQTISESRVKPAPTKHGKDVKTRRSTLAENAIPNKVRTSNDRSAGMLSASGLTPEQIAELL